MNQSDRVRVRWLLALGCLPIIVLPIMATVLMVNLSQSPTPTPRLYSTSPPVRLAYPTLNLPATMEALMTQSWRPTPTLMIFGGHGQPEELADDKAATRTMTPLAETPAKTPAGTDVATPIP